jgi:hypothetical protein
MESSDIYSSAFRKRHMRKHKYNAIKTVIDGITFDSKLEAKRYSQLKILERSNEISNLELQIPMHIVINDVKICKYICDFRYTCNGKVIHEDAKGMTTPVFNLKKKLVKAVHGVDITIYKG